MTNVQYPIGAVEYVKATVTCDFELDDQTVAISIDNKATWLPGTWVGDVGTVRQVRTTDPYTFSAALTSRPVYVKITDSPEVPIIKADGKLSAA